MPVTQQSPALSSPPLPPQAIVPSAPSVPSHAIVPSTQLPTQPKPRRRVDWGVFVPGFPGNVTAIDGAEHAAGRHVDIVMWYVHWGGAWSGFNAADVRAVIAHGSLPLITWMSDDPSASGYPNPSSQRAFTVKAILAGRYDSYIRSWAIGLRHIGSNVLLRFDHEMNGNWYAWSPGINGQSAHEYVAAWRHVHDIFTASGANNVQWVWSPNVVFDGSIPLASVYPGDAYVDRVGLDGYNWGASDRDHTWQSFAAVFDATQTQVAAITRRPAMICEVASTEVGGDKAAWIRDFFFAVAHRPVITGFVWFNADKETDWRLDSSPAARSAFRAGLTSLS